MVRSHRRRPRVSEPDDLPALRTGHDRGAHQHEHQSSGRAHPAGEPLRSEHFENHHTEARVRAVVEGAVTTWSDEVDEILASDLAAGLAYLTPAKGVVITPMAPLGLRDREA